MPRDHGVCVCQMNEWMFTPSVVCHTEKKSDGKSKYLLPVAPGKPVAPLFLQGLSDLQVMDGSQVTMTVQVSGLSLRLSPQDVCESGRVCSVGVAPRSLTHQKISQGL